MSTTPMSDFEMLLTERETAAFLKVSVRTLQAWRSQAKGPPFVRLGRVVRYVRGSLIEWINSTRS